MKTPGLRSVFSARPSAVMLLIMGLCTAGMAGCGGKDAAEEGSLDKLQQQAQQMQKAAESMSDASQTSHEPVPPVSFRVLQGFLPKSIGNLTAGEPEGETTSMGEWRFSQATIAFNSEDGAKSVHIEIFDYAYIQSLYAPWRMLLAMGYDRETSKGYERAVKIADNPAYEKWEAPDTQGEVMVMLGDRFIVTCRTNGLGEGEARKIVEGMDLKSLASQKAS